MVVYNKQLIGVVLYFNTIVEVGIFGEIILILKTKQKIDLLRDLYKKVI